MGSQFEPDTIIALGLCSFASNNMDTQLLECFEMTGVRKSVTLTQNQVNFGQGFGGQGKYTIQDWLIRIGDTYCIPRYESNVPTDLGKILDYFDPEIC